MNKVAVERSDFDDRTPSRSDIDRALSELNIQPVTGMFGSEVSGFKITEPMIPALVKALSELIYRYKVLIFRNQPSVGPQELADFARNFGEPESVAHPVWPDFPGIPAIKVITSDVINPDSHHIPESWHTDGSTREQTNWLSFLQAIDIPAQGRDTLFADMEAVFDQLSPTLQTLFSGMNTFQSWRSAKPGVPLIRQPMVYDNPVTGRRALYVNHHYTDSIEGLYPSESRLLLEYINRLVHVPENQVRVAWQPGTITVWDNRRTQHYLLQDARYMRVMHRVMILRS